MKRTKISSVRIVWVAIVALVALFMVSGIAAAPRVKTKAQCKAELNQCLYQTCKTQGVSEKQDTACVNRCTKNGQSCMMGAKK